MAEPRDTADRPIKAFNASGETTFTDLLGEDVTPTMSCGARP